MINNVLKKIIRIIGIILIACISCMVIEIIIFFLRRDDLIKYLPASEVSKNEIPYVSSYEILTDKDNKKAYISAWHVKPGYKIEETFCVYGDEAYFMCTTMYGSNPNWIIAATDMKTKEFDIKCEYDDEHTDYRINHSVEYAERYGYYYDGKIILTNFNTLMEYDIITDTSTIYDFQSYEHPNLPMYASNSKDSQTIEVFDDGETRTYTLQAMVEESEAIAKIYELKDEKIWDDYFSALNPEWFFSEFSVNLTADGVYAIGECFDYHGEAYGIVLKYDAEQNRWKYITYAFCGEHPRDKCYPVSTVKIN